MARAVVRRLRAMALGAHRLPVADPAQGATTDRVDRMARFAAGARRLVMRAVTVGSLVAAGWLLAVVFGMLTADPAAADATATAEATATADATAAAATTASAEAKATAEAEATAETAATAPAMAAAKTAVSDAAALQSLTSPDRVSESDNAEAMAGRTVDGLNSQQDPGLPAPSTAGKILDTNGLVPNGGAGGLFGAAAGDVARSVFDPRLQARRAILARVLPPVVRTAADDPSFSPD
ncbi:hypothetical protein [Nonomuraea helvata]|uniref:Peptidoglycan-binding protein n=1 Tax=Nonomuraea helvata TaxID=37484 RepID=A0ABV5SBD5_9ACTN